MNRFTGDIAAVDYVIPDRMLDFLQVNQPDIAYRQCT